MHFNTYALAALSIGSALAKDITVHVVKVGDANGTLAFFPNNLNAAVGEMVQFQFAPHNHTVTQSTFDKPCQPIALHSNVTGIYSGFMPVAADAEMTPTYTIMVNNTTPMWLYCSQGKHCQNGMTMVINENTKVNDSRSLTAFQALAKTQTSNLAGDAVSNGTVSSTSSSAASSTTAGAIETTTAAASSAALTTISRAVIGAMLVVAGLAVSL